MSDISEVRRPPTRWKYHNSLLVRMTLSYVVDGWH